MCQGYRLNFSVPLFLIILSQVYWTAGQPEEGLERLVEAAKLIETTGERWAEAELYGCGERCCCR